MKNTLKSDALQAICDLLGIAPARTTELAERLQDAGDGYATCLELAFKGDGLPSLTSKATYEKTDHLKAALNTIAEFASSNATYAEILKAITTATNHRIKSPLWKLLHGSRFPKRWQLWTLKTRYPGELLEQLKIWQKCGDRLTAMEWLVGEELPRIYNDHSNLT